MPVGKIILERGLTINTGNFQNEKIAARVEYIIDEGQSLDEARAEALDEVQVQLLELAAPVLAALPEYQRECLLEQICPLKVAPLAPQTIRVDKS